MKVVEASPKWRKRIQAFVVCYAIVICLLCFSPQPVLISGFSTPGIQYYGRMVFLLTPFNSFHNLGELQSWGEVFWVFAQNVMNVFLLTPLVFACLWLKPNWRSYRKSLTVAFLLSFGIEVTQLLVDFLYDANRVFEIDDLWTNTLGGAVAFACFKLVNCLLYNTVSQKKHKEQSK